MLENIQWKPCYEYEDYYLVSNTGLIKSIDRIINNRNCKGKILKFKDIRGYKNVRLYKNKEGKTKQVHRLVALTFNFNTNHKNLQINHLDGDKSNNNIDNLQWCTAKENQLYSYRTVHKNDNLQKGENNNAAKLDYRKVRIIRNSSLSDINCAKLFNVCRQTINLVRNNKIWIK